MTITLGQAIWASVKPIIKIYLIIGSGFILTKCDILSVEATKCVSNVVLTLLLPCLSFNKIVANIEDNDIKSVGIVCLTSLLLFVTGFFFAWLCRLLLPVPRQWRGGILAGGMFPNISDLPIAYLQTMDQGLIFTEAEGDKGVANVIIFLAMFLFCVFNLGGFRLMEMDFKYRDEESAEYIEDNKEIKEDGSSSSLTAPQPAHVLQAYNLPTESNSFIEELASVQASPLALHQNSETSSGDHPVALTDHSILLRRSITGRSAIDSISDRTLESGEDVNDLVREYSNVNQFGKRRNSMSTMGSAQQSSIVQRIKTSDLTRMLTSDATVSRQDIKNSGGSLPSWLRKYSFTAPIMFFIKNCLRPCPLAVIVALTIAFIPWVKALFVTTSNTPHIKQAPDEQPALSFIMDFTSYIGAASVPFGLLLLGATLGRLKIKKLYPGFWKTAVVLVVLRQCVMPIFGVLWCDRLVKAGWVNWEDDRMLLFAIAINWGLPTMTTIIYFTASYTPLDAVDTTQMDCVSLFLNATVPSPNREPSFPCDLLLESATTRIVTLDGLSFKTIRLHGVFFGLTISSNSYSTVSFVPTHQIDSIGFFHAGN